MNRLPFSITEQTLREVFGKYGNIRSVKIKRPNINAPSMGAGPVFTTAYGIAYVDFEKEDEAAKALAELNGTEI